MRFPPLQRGVLAAAADGRVRVAIGRASDFFGPGVTQGSTLGERVFGNALAGRRADFIGDPMTANPKPVNAMTISPVAATLEPAPASAAGFHDPAGLRPMVP